jgi:hypothetical protein
MAGGAAGLNAGGGVTLLIQSETYLALTLQNSASEILAR